MLPIYYKSAEGTVLDLIGTNYKMLTETDVFDWDWQPETVGNNYPYITAFKNQMATKTIKVVVKGSSESDLREKLKHLIEVVDRDTRLLQNGRFYAGTYFLECFIIGNKKTTKFLNKNMATIELTLIVESADWISEQQSAYSGLSGGSNVNKYAVATVSSNSNNYIYDLCTDKRDLWNTVSNQWGSYFQCFDSHILRITSCENDITWRYASDDYTDPSNIRTIHPSDCPVDIGMIGKHVEENGVIITGSTTRDEITFDRLTNDNCSYIRWKPTSDDNNPTFIIDLGTPIELRRIIGMTIGMLDNTAGGGTVYMSVSANGTDWTQVANNTIPTTYNGTTTLSKVWSSDYPTIRYIKVYSAVSSGTQHYPFTIMTNSLQINAHIDGESQNLALSATANATGGITLHEWEIANNQRKITATASGIGTVDIELPKICNVISVQGISVTVADPTSFYLEYVDDDDVVHNIHQFEPNRGGITVPVDFQNLELENVKTIRIRTTDATSIFIAGTNIVINEEISDSPDKYIVNDNYVPSDAIIKIYGPTNNPSIQIGDNLYGVEGITLEEDEYLEINTKDETIKRYTDDGGFTNEFARRLDQTFEKIEVGSQEITWEGNLNVDIELICARSDPKWS